MSAVIQQSRGSITKSAVEMRLNPLGWPEGLDSKDVVAVGYESAANLATSIYGDFLKEHEKNERNTSYTPAGVIEASAKWADNRLEDLRKQKAKVKADIERQREGAMKIMTESFTKPAEEPQDIALLQEVRTWLRTMPESERTTKIFALARKGDRTALNRAGFAGGSNS